MSTVASPGGVPVSATRSATPAATSSRTPAATALPSMIVATTSAPRDRGVGRHELALRSIAGEANHDDPAGLDPRDHALAEGGVHDVVAEAELRRGRGLALRALPCGLRGAPRSAAGRDAHPGLGLVVGQLRGDLVDEAAAQAVHARTEDVAGARITEVEVALGAGDADVAEPALLLEPALVQRPRVWEDALLAPDDEHDRELQPLRVVQRHERHEALLVAQCVGVGEQRDLLEEAVERGVLDAGVVLARHLDELLEVLQPPLRLDRALVLQCLGVA